jgi:hypothetical protein
MEFNDDGTRMYILDNLDDSVYQYALAVPYQVATAYFEGTLDVSNE